MSAADACGVCGPGCVCDEDGGGRAGLAPWLVDADRCAACCRFQVPCVPTEGGLGPILDWASSNGGMADGPNRDSIYAHAAGGPQHSACLAGDVVAALAEVPGGFVALDSTGDYANDGLYVEGDWTPRDQLASARDGSGARYAAAGTTTGPACRSGGNGRCGDGYYAGGIIAPYIWQELRLSPTIALRTRPERCGDFDPCDPYDLELTLDCAKPHSTCLMRHRIQVQDAGLGLALGTSQSEHADL